MASTGKIVIDNSRVFKTTTQYLQYGVVERESFWLGELSDTGITPKLYNCQDNTIEMEYVGATLLPFADFNNKDYSNIPEIPDNWKEQVHEISRILKEYNCKHNDIKPWDICIKDGKIFVIDFQWATNYNEQFPTDWPDVGGDFKIRSREYNDLFSLETSFYTTIKLKSLVIK